MHAMQRKLDGGMSSAQSFISGTVKGKRARLKFTALTQKKNYDMQVSSFLPQCDVTDTSLFFPVSLLVLIIPWAS